MDVKKILADIKAELDHIKAVIASLRRPGRMRRERRSRAPAGLWVPPQGGTPPAPCGALDAARSAVPRG